MRVHLRYHSAAMRTGKDCLGIIACCSPLLLLLPLCVADTSEADIEGNVTLTDVLYVFDRPTEPIFTLRGVNRDVLFDIPPEYLPDRYRRVASDVYDNVTGKDIRLIPIKAVDVPEHLLETRSTLAFREKYSFAIGSHASIMLRFYNSFMEFETLDEFLSAVVWARCHFNPEMVLDAVRMAILSRQDTQALQLPEVTQYHPELFVDDIFFSKAREEMWTFADPQERVAIPVTRNGTASKADEDALWFFREDAGLNLFHWHWHVSHPNKGRKSAVEQDRRGELFAYFHRQILARYNANRFCLGMKPMESLKLREPITEGYAPKLAVLHGSRSFPSRQPNTTLEDVALDRTVAGVNMGELERWVAAARKAIARGWASRKSGARVLLERKEGLDILANALEGVKTLSPDYDQYGNLHNHLHRLVGYSHDPNHLFNEPMGTLATLNIIRDPVFFRIHGFMDDLYEEYKATLKPYESSDLEFPDVQLSSVQVQSSGGVPRNELRSIWLETDLDVSLGLEYTPPGPLFARFQRLVHRPFRYTLQVKNAGNTTKEGFVRIFLLLQTDGNGDPLNLSSVQRWSIEMDRFKATISPGKSEITRKSIETPVAIDPDSIYEVARTPKSVRAVNHCRCGLPLSLLIPRGTAQGYKVTLFAMISDYSKEGVNPSDGEICREGWALCGAPGSRLYPDKRPMGFPFDRRFRNGVDKVQDFLTDNMAVKDVVIKFEDTVQAPSPLLSSGRSTSWKASEEAE